MHQLKWSGHGRVSFMVVQVRVRVSIKYLGCTPIFLLTSKTSSLTLFFFQYVAVRLVVQ